MKTIRRLSDRVVETLMPKTDASALYYWRQRCTANIVCRSNGRNYNTLIAEYVHEGSGTVTETRLLGCC